MSPMALAWQQFRFERKLFWRNPSAAFFNFLLPLLLLVLTASAFSANQDELEILIPGIAGMGVLATTFTSLAFNLTILREDGVLKRWRGTPMPAGSYLAGLLASAEKAVALSTSSSSGSTKLKKAALGLRQNSLRSKRNWCQARAMGLMRRRPPGSARGRPPRASGG